MINPLTSSLLRVIIFWYSIGTLVLFIGPPEWAGVRYEKLMAILPVPILETSGIVGAASVQWHLLAYWTAPLLLIWLISLISGVAVCEIRFRVHQYFQRLLLKPKGEFKGVTVASYSIGAIPQATVPAPVKQPVQIISSFSPRRLLSGKKTIQVVVSGRVREVLGWLTPEELALSQELVGVLFTSPAHYAGAGHGVGLLEHTLNVLEEASKNCTENFRLPVVAALAHDVGKLLTFQPDGEGGWKRVGLHSRESARILATLPSFELLTPEEQRGLLLAVKYDHAPSKIPLLGGDKDASMLALRIISAVSSADRAATAAEKDRNLERIQPEDILWRDFADFLREAPVAQRGGKLSAANQVNNPMDSPYLYLYEAPWRDAAVRRLPEEVAAALDLTRRDNGRTAKYTRILAEYLRKEGLLVEEYTPKAGEPTMRVPEQNPLWDIRSGSKEKGIEFRGVLVLHAERLWKKLNYRLGTWSPYPVTILAPNAENRKEEAAQKPPTMAELGFKVDAPDTSEAHEAAPIKTGIRKRLLSRAAGQTVQPSNAPLVEVDETPPDAALTPENDLTSSNTSSTQQAMAYLVEAESSRSKERDLTPDVARVLPVDAPDGLPETSITLGETAEDNRVQEAVGDSESTGEVLTPQGKKRRARQKSESQKQTLFMAPPEKPALSRSERNLGIAIADAATVASYPNLTIGQKYYTEQSSVVLERGVAAGTPYPDGGTVVMRKTMIEQKVPVVPSTPSPVAASAQPTEISNSKPAQKPAPSARRNSSAAQATSNPLDQLLVKGSTAQPSRPIRRKFS